MHLETVGYELDDKYFRFYTRMKELLNRQSREK